ncbi:MAG: hypothetical protein QXU67_05940, partial [Candidatus Bathyarchaeia archaeon]
MKDKRERETKAKKETAPMFAPPEGTPQEAIDLRAELLKPANVNAKNLFEEINGYDIDTETSEMWEYLSNYVGGRRNYDWDGDGNIEYLYDYDNLGGDSQAKALKCVASWAALYDFRQQFNNLSSTIKDTLYNNTGVQFDQLKNVMIHFGMGPNDVYHVYEYIFTLLCDENGQLRDVSDVIEFLKILAEFYNEYTASALRIGINGILKSAYTIDFENSNEAKPNYVLTGNIDLKEIAVLGNKNNGILYDNNGNPRDAQKTIDFFEAVVGFVNTYNGLSSADKAKANPILNLYGVNLADGVVSKDDIKGLGNDQAPNYNPIYRADGSIRNPTDTFNFFIAAGDFVNTYNGLAAANKTKVDVILALYNINLSDGLDITDLTNLGNDQAPNYNPIYRADGSIRNPTDTFNFYIAVVDFYNAWNTHALKADINNLILNPIYTIDLSDGLQLADVTNFGKDTAPEYNPLYKADGTLRDGTKTLEFFAAAVDFYNKWNTHALKADINNLILTPIYNINLSDGLSLADITGFGKDSGPEYNPLYNMDATLRDNAKTLEFFSAAINFFNTYNTLTATGRAKVDSILALYGIDFTDGLISLTDITGLGNDQAPNYNPIYRADGSIRNPTDTFNFFIAAGDFVNTYNGLAAA